MLPDIDLMTDGTLQQHDGVWTSKTKTRISYPEAGNADCLKIEDESYWFEHRKSIIISLLHQHAAPDSRNFFADIGGGNGFQSKVVQDTGLTTVLIEPGLTGCINAKHRGVQHVVNATLETSG